MNEKINSIDKMAAISNLRAQKARELNCGFYDGRELLILCLHVSSEQEIKSPK